MPARRLLVHDGEEPVARLAIVARRTPQGLDEAEQRGERGAQLVTRIGDEIGTHLLAPFRGGEIVQGNDDGAGGDMRAERRDAGAELALDRQAEGELDEPLALAAQYRIDGGEHCGMAQARGKVPADELTAEHLVRRLVGAHYPSALVKQEHRIGKRGENGLGRGELSAAVGETLPRDAGQPADRPPQLGNQWNATDDERRRLLVVRHQLDRGAQRGETREQRM